MSGLDNINMYNIFCIIIIIMIIYIPEGGVGLLEHDGHDVVADVPLALQLLGVRV